MSIEVYIVKPKIFLFLKRSLAFYSSYSILHLATLIIVAETEEAGPGLTTRTVLKYLGTVLKSLQARVLESAARDAT